MFRLTAFTALLIAAMVQADDKLIVPKTAPPQFVTVNAFDAGREEITVAVVAIQAVPETRTRQLVVNGQTRTETYTVLVNVAVSRMERKSTRGAKYLNSEGKAVDKASALQMLKRGNVILWSESQDGVDPLYLKPLSKDALIVIEAPVLP